MIGSRGKSPTKEGKPNFHSTKRNEIEDGWGKGKLSTEELNEEI